MTDITVCKNDCIDGGALAKGGNHVKGSIDINVSFREFM